MQSDIINKLNLIQSRLEKIEKQLQITPPTSLLPDTTVSAAPAAPDRLKKGPLSPEEFLQQLNQKPIESIPQPSRPNSFVNQINQSKSPAHSEDFSLSAGKWLGIIGIIFFVLAAGFIIKLSIDTGWLTPLKQVLLAAVFGFVLLGIGLKLKDTDQSYTSLLPGAGIVVLFLTVFGAFRFHELISYQLALALVACVSLLCVLMYTELEHDVYALTAAVGSYLSPFILNFETVDSFTYYYMLFCSVAFSVISILLRTRTFSIVASYLAILMTWGLASHQNQHQLGAVCLGLTFLIFSISTALFSIQHKKQMTKQEAWAFFPVLITFYAAEFYFIDRLYPDIAPYVSLGFGVACIGLYFLSKKALSKDSLESGSMLISFFSIVLFHTIYLEILPSQVRPFLFVLFILLYTLTDVRAFKQGMKELILAPLLIILILLIEFVTVVGQLLTSKETLHAYTGLSFLASLWVLLLFSKVDRSKNQDFVLLIAAHVLAVTSLYRLVFDYGSLAVSISWLFYSVVIISLGFLMQDKQIAKSTLIVLMLAACKVLLYDMSQAESIVRILCLLLTGIMLYTVGFIFRKIEMWGESRKK